MSYDWNSFYGTFAQTAGAFIGIIAAFLISRILSLKDRESAIRDEFDRLLNQRLTLQTAFDKRQLTWVNEIVVKNSEKLRTQIQNGTFDGLSEKEIISKIREVVDVYDDPKGLLVLFNNLKSELFRSHFLKIPPSKDVWKTIDEERNRIADLEVQVYSLIDLFRANKDNCLHANLNNVRPLRRIAVVLLASFPLFVVYPLHFLPIAANTVPSVSFEPTAMLNFFVSIKGGLLLSFFLITTGMFIYLLQLVISIERGMEFIVSCHIPEFYRVKSYCCYLDERNSILDLVLEDVASKSIKHESLQND